MEGMKDKVQAGAFIARNGALREALGIEPGVQVEVFDLAQGEHNANFRFVHPGTGQAYVLRVNHRSQLGLADQIGYEYHLLEVLEPSGRTPRAFYVDSSSDWFARGALVMECFEGAHLDFGNDAHLRQAAAALADVHALAVPEDDDALVCPGDTLQDLYDECAGFVDQYRRSGLADDALLARMERFLASCHLELGPRKVVWPRKHLISTEPVPSHFLMDETDIRASRTGDGVFAHFIDWDKALVGENTRDVAYFLAPTSTVWDTDFIFDEAHRDSFVRAYWKAVDGRFPESDFAERLNAYIKMNCLRGTTWSARAWVEYRSGATPLINQKTWDKLEKYYLNPDFLDYLEETWFRVSTRS